MKKIIYYSIITSSALMWSACNSNKDSKEKADSVNRAQDSINNKMAGTGDLELSKPDADFAVAAANGGMAELELGKLAEEKGSSQAVKDFGTMMVNDHSKANMELKQLAERKKIMLPDSVGKEEQQFKKDLSKKPGAEFDKAYVNAMVEDHKKDIAEFEEYKGKVKYPEMKALIEKALPMLKMHLGN